MADILSGFNVVTNWQPSVRTANRGGAQLHFGFLVLISSANVGSRDTKVTCLCSEAEVSSSEHHVPKSAMLAGYEVETR